MASKPDWFTIKEAAEYLGVGEPTIFRWMRDKRLTYRKVGDSTRFLQPDLDAMVQVYPAEGDVARAKEFCPVCHCDQLVPGTLRSTGLLHFQPEQTKFWTLKDSSISVSGRMCSRCGAIFQFGDLDKLGTLKVNEEAK